MSLLKPDYTRLGPPSGNTVLVIGGCGGIGLAIVRASIEIGLNVVVMDIEQSLAICDLPKSVSSISIDLREEAAIENAFHCFDNLQLELNHIVFASGYTADLVNVEDLTADVLDDVMGGNLRGHVFAARAGIKRVKQGSFVFVSTAMGQVGAPGYAPYAMSKAGMNALIRIMAAENAKHIRVNGIAPGPVDTPFIRGGLGRGITNEEDMTGGPASRFDKTAFEARTPMGRLGNANDMAGPTLFLLSDAARFITGQVLHINGGAFMRD